MAINTSTRATTRAKVLTAVTVAAAGVAAYMAGSLSNDLLQNSVTTDSITRADRRYSCLLTCEHNGGFPCGASIDAASEAACSELVRSCQASCPAPDEGSVLLRADGSVELLPRAQLSLGYSKTLVALPIETVQGGIWEVTKGALPPGMTLDSASGRLFGTPTSADTFEFAVTRSVTNAKQANPIRSTAHVVLVVENQQVPMNTVGSAVPAAGAALSSIDITTPIGEVFLTREQEFDLQMNVYGIPAAEQQWSIAYGRLPEGMELTPLGRLRGRPTEKVGDYRFGVMVTSLRHAAAGIRDYSDGVIRVVEADQPALGSAVPPEYPPTNADADLEANTVMLPGALPVGRVGEAYSVPLSVNDSIARVWSISGLPQGLSFASESHVINGTPTQDGVYTVEVAASRAAGGSFTKTYSLTINRAPVLTDADIAASHAIGEAAPGIIIDINVPEAIAGRPYSAQLRGMSSYASLRWSLSSSRSVPAGWSLSSSGVLTHANPLTGIVTIPVIARTTDGAVSAEEDLAINVRPATVAEQGAAGSSADAHSATGGSASAASSQVLAFTNVGMYPDGTVGVAYNSRPFEVTGGQGAYTYSRSSGTLPPGLTLSTNGAIQGTPTAVGSHSFTMRITDSAGGMIQASRTIRVVAAPVSGSGSGQVVSGGGGGGGGVASVTVLPNSESAATQARLNVLNRLGIRVHDLVKLQDDGDPNTQHDTTVYYIGSDGRRHFFPNPKVFFTWFHDFNTVRIVSATSLAEIPLGANVTYRPGVRMVKFESDNKVYVVEGGRRLRWIQSEQDASSIYGVNWNRNIDDIPVVFYTDYVFGATLGSAASFSPAVTMAMITWPSQVLP